MFINIRPNTVQLVVGEPVIAGEHHRLQPELADHALAANVDMFRLETVETVEEEPVWTGNA